jgi:hypothetical protein
MSVMRAAVAALVTAAAGATAAAAARCAHVCCHAVVQQTCHLQTCAMQCHVYMLRVENVGVPRSVSLITHHSSLTHEEPESIRGVGPCLGQVAHTGVCTQQYTAAEGTQKPEVHNRLRQWLAWPAWCICTQPVKTDSDDSRCCYDGKPVACSTSSWGMQHQPQGALPLKAFQPATAPHPRYPQTHINPPILL